MLMYTMYMFHVSSCINYDCAYLSKYLKVLADYPIVLILERRRKKREHVYPPYPRVFNLPSNTTLLGYIQHTATGQSSRLYPLTQ